MRHLHQKTRKQQQKENEQIEQTLHRLGSVGILVKEQREVESAGKWKQRLVCAGIPMRRHSDWVKGARRGKPGLFEKINYICREEMLEQKEKRVSESRTMQAERQGMTGKELTIKQITTNFCIMFLKHPPTSPGLVIHFITAVVWLGLIMTNNHEVKSLKSCQVRCE